MVSALTEFRFFADGVYTLGDTLTITGDDAHRIHHVLRLRRGDTLEICDSAATVFIAEVRDEGREVVLQLRELAEPAPIAKLELVLAQCLPKAAKMDFIVEKATELGVDAIIPVQSGRVVGERGSVATRHERWRRLAKAAAEQSHAPRIPVIHDVHSWPELCARFGEFARVLIPWELSERQPRDLEELRPTAGRVLVVIGPEGGLSHDEMAQAKAAGGLDISLGTRILRTETAGFIAAALVRYAADDL